MEVQKFLEELSVQQLTEKYNFIVPEIQREYVWGNNDYQILDKFFNDIKEAFKETKDNNNSIQINELQKMLDVVDEQTKTGILNAIEKLSKRDLNIGFLYSYKPYYNYIGDKVDVYLIDGQQRLTTLFLTLFYLSLKEKSNGEDFYNLIRFDVKLEKIGFDYRVRTLTHNFLIDLIQHCRKLDDLENITEQNWFLADYSNDVTVKSMLGAIKLLGKHFKEDSCEYYQFVKKQIRFWHFKTEETSQGEELYITMNSRGQQLADNETVRAKLFENPNIKANQIQWGERWERWQDFFWKNKIEDGNADIGLNQFLRWVNIIECFLNEKYEIKEVGEKVYKQLYSENIVLEAVSLIEIQSYFDALEQLKIYYDEGYFESVFFNNNFKPHWLQGDISQIDLIKLLPALIYVKSYLPKEGLNKFIRFFYNLTHDADISKNPDTYIIESIQLTKLFLDNNLKDISDMIVFKDKFPRLLSSEEVFKLTLYKNEKNTNKRNILEEAFWTAEDFKFSNGKIGHLIQLTIHQGSIKDFIYKQLFDYQIDGKFNLNNFSGLFKSYAELIQNEEEIWGNLITTQVYRMESDKVYAEGKWHINSGFLKYVYRRYLRTSEILVDFLISDEKKFVIRYKDKQQMFKETNSKKQLYIYYILHKRILNKWNWSKWNFGKYSGDDYPNTSSLFSEKFIYQFYNSQWRYNVGYESGTGIWIQDNFDSKRNYLQELMNWAKQ